MPLKKSAFQRILKAADIITSFMDVFLFLWYGVLRNAIKEIKKMEIKKTRGIIRGTKLPDFTAAFASSVKQLSDHRAAVPYFIRLIPSLIAICAIYLIVA